MTFNWAHFISSNNSFMVQSFHRLRPLQNFPETVYLTPVIINTSTGDDGWSHPVAPLKSPGHFRTFVVSQSSFVFGVYAWTFLVYLSFVVRFESTGRLHFLIKTCVRCLGKGTSPCRWTAWKSALALTFVVGCCRPLLGNREKWHHTVLSVEFCRKFCCLAYTTVHIEHDSETV